MQAVHMRMVQAVHIENEQWCTPQGYDARPLKRQDAQAERHDKRGCNESGQWNVQGLCVSQAAMKSKQECDFCVHEQRVTARTHEYK